MNHGGSRIEDCGLSIADAIDPSRRIDRGNTDQSSLTNHQSSMVKLAHFSDIHLTARPLGWTVRDVFGKRTTGWVNVNVLGRGSRFQHAPSVVDVLRREFATRGSRPPRLLRRRDHARLRLRDGGRGRGARRRR